MSPQDAGNPDPELQAIALRELNMLLSDLGISLNQSRRTSVIVPNMRDRIIFEMSRIPRCRRRCRSRYRLPRRTRSSYKAPTSNRQPSSTSMTSSR